MSEPVKCSHCGAECVLRFGGQWCFDHGWEVPPTPSPATPRGVFDSCLIEGCETPLVVAADLFCPDHYRTVPRDIRHSLEAELAMRRDPGPRWHELVRAANDAAAVTRGTP